MKNYWQWRYQRDKKLNREYCFGKEIKLPVLKANAAAEETRMEKFTDGKSFKNMLDFGCGIAVYNNVFRREKYLGVDVVPELIEKNKERFPDLKFQVIREIDYLEDYYELIYCRIVLQHFKKDALLHWLNEFYVATNNLIILSNPGTMTVPIQEENTEAAASTCRRPDDLAEILRENGWQIYKSTDRNCLIWAVQA